jgi:predicted AAA+ superfamily ATPase
LTPFLLSELNTMVQRERRWLCGGFPDGGVLSAKRYPRWQRDYLALLTQRDLPAWGFSAKPQTTDRLLRMLAPLNGQIWNASQVGQSLGLSYHTVNNYLDYLEGAFLFRRLQPYHTNIHKRLIKSPKIYWRDTGLLHAILNVTDRQTLIAQPWVGASWEGFVVEQILGELSSKERQFSAFFFRTSDRYELDLVLDFGDELWAVEVKLTASPAPEDMARLDKTADMVKASRRFLISQTRRPSGGHRRVSCDLPTFIEQLDD